MILPAYNEARRLPASLVRCARYLESQGIDAEIIVADDGSTDDTPEVFRATVATLEGTRITFQYVAITHAGKGAAVRAGVKAAHGDPVVFLDSDLTIPVEIIPDFLEMLRSGADVVVASRYARGSVVRRPIWRRVAGETFRTLVRALVTTDVRDTQCGGKAYTAAAAGALYARQLLDGFAFDAEVLHIAHLLRMRVVEVPFTLDQPRGTSIDFLSDAPRMLVDLIRIRVSAVRGRYR